MERASVQSGSLTPAGESSALFWQGTAGWILEWGGCASFVPDGGVLGWQRRGPPW